MLEVLMNLIYVVCAVSLVLFAYHIYKMLRRLGLARLPATKQFNPHEDVTTILPVPLHASTCDHDWEAVTDHVLDMPHEKRSVTVLSCRRCGSLDKTVQSTSPAPPAVPEPPRICHHEWESLVHEVLEMDHESKVVVVLSCRKCGLLDKTTEISTKPASKDDCRHQWTVEKKVDLSSAYEQMAKAGQKASSPDKLPAWMFRKTLVSVRTCNKCGEVEKTVASNFDVGEEEEIEG